tara:strand:+ start:111 stop:362 length:252 start_codon:yes stop_codon:yes gene_type:complete
MILSSKGAQADNPASAASHGEGDHVKAPARNRTIGKDALLAVIAPVVIPQTGTIPIKVGNAFKADAMLGQVAAILGLVPLEFH